MEIAQTETEKPAVQPEDPLVRADPLPASRELVRNIVAVALGAKERTKPVAKKTRHQWQSATAVAPKLTQAFPEITVEEFIKQVPPHTLTQRMMHFVALKIRGVKDPLGRHQ